MMFLSYCFDVLPIVLSCAHELWCSCYLVFWLFIRARIEFETCVDQVKYLHRNTLSNYILFAVDRNRLNIVNVTFDILSSIEYIENKHNSFCI